MAYQFIQPDKTFIGDGALEAAKSAVCKLGTKALIVTGKHITAGGLVNILTQKLDSWGIGYTLFNGITGEPTVQMIQEGVEAFRKNGCDFLIGFGGGSPLDSAKAIAAMSALPGSIADYAGKEISGGFPPFMLIPTTAGTGSEATKFTIITDTEKDVKMLLKGEQLIPQVAVIEPSFDLSAPKNITASTGMDALTHAVEAYTSRLANPITDMYALTAIKKIFTWLPEAYKDGNNKEARGELALAAYLAGVCINNASVTIVHGMSRPIGALFHVPHGISNAMLICNCLSFALDGCYQKFAEIACTLGIADRGTGEKEAAEAFIGKLKDLCRTLEIPSLAGYGIDKARFDSLIDKMTGDAIASGSPGNTIKPVSKEDICALYKSLWE